MKKKLLLLTSTISLSLLAVFTVVNSHESVYASSLNSSKIVEGSITIGEGENTFKNESGSSQFYSSNNNKFSFSYSNVVKNDNLYTLSSTSSIKNNVALHGIYRIDILGCTSSCRAYIDSGFEEANEDRNLIKIDSSTFSYTFETNKPNYIELKGYSSYTLSFSKIVIYYSCQEGTHYYETFMQRTYEGLTYSNSSDSNIIISQQGVNISDIATDNFGFYRTRSSKLGRDVSDISVRYVEDELNNSTTVIEGTHEVSVTYSYGGYTYFNANPIMLYGFDHTELDYVSASLSPHEFKVQDNDNLPTGLSYEINSLRVWLLDSQNNKLKYIAFNAGLASLSGTSYTTSDNHPFSTIGEKTIKITKLGLEIELQYTVYDPEINNIKNVSYYGSITVPKQSSKDKFLKIVQTLKFEVDYYEYDGASPFEITGQSIDFLVDDSTFDVNTSTVEISVKYRTYTGKIGIELIEPDGELINYYTSYYGVASLALNFVIRRIEIFDNGIKFFDNVSGTGIPNFIDRDFVCISYSETSLYFGARYEHRFTLNGDDHTFWNYIGGESLYGKLTNTAEYDDHYDYAKLELFSDGYARFYSSDNYSHDCRYTLSSNTVSFEFYSFTATIDTINKTFSIYY